MKELQSLQIEKHTLAGILRFPAVFSQIDSFVSEKDFVSKAHKIIFSVVKNLILQRQKYDRVILAKKITDIGINNVEEVSVFDYLESLFGVPIKEGAVVPAAKELVELRIRRDYYNTTEKIKRYLLQSKDKPIQEVIQECDKLFNENVSGLNLVNNETKDLFALVEDFIEDLGNNPPDPRRFLMGPFPSINSQIGSLTRPGNITVVGARTGVAKTTLGMFYLTHVAEGNGLPIIHLDNGEMDEESLMIRAVCMFTKGQVSYDLLEKGKWRNNPITTQLVREVWPRVKKTKYYYEQVGSKSPLEICNTIRRVAYNKIGRGNPFLVHFDYLKSLNSDNYKTPDWLLVGAFIQDLKLLAQNELNIPVWTSVQVNKSGVTNNKVAAQVDDSDASLSLSDKIIQQASHAFILRNKTSDEITLEQNKFGNLKLIRLKSRFLGEDYSRAITPVKMPNGTHQSNYYNIQSSSFWMEEKGDLHDVVSVLKEEINLKDASPDIEGDGTLM